MLIFKSRVTAQVEKEIDITRHWRLDEVGEEMDEDVLYSSMQALQNRRGKSVVSIILPAPVQ